MGVLRGFDQFMNLVLDGTVDTKTKADIGMVVSASCSFFAACHVGCACVILRADGMQQCPSICSQLCET